jgi:hypothetical protein
MHSKPYKKPSELRLKINPMIRRLGAGYFVDKEQGIIKGNLQLVLLKEIASGHYEVNDTLAYEALRLMVDCYRSAMPNHGFSLTQQAPFENPARALEERVRQFRALDGEEKSHLFIQLGLLPELVAAFATMHREKLPVLQPDTLEQATEAQRRIDFDRGKRPAPTPALQPQPQPFKLTHEVMWNVGVIRRDGAFFERQADTAQLARDRYMLYQIYNGQAAYNPQQAKLLVERIGKAQKEQRAERV